MYENGRAKTTCNKSCDYEDEKKFTCCDKGDDGGGNDGTNKKKNSNRAKNKKYLVDEKLAKKSESDY